MVYGLGFMVCVCVCVSEGGTEDPQYPTHRDFMVFGLFPGYWFWCGCWFIIIIAIIIAQGKR